MNNSRPLSLALLMMLTCAPMAAGQSAFKTFAEVDRYAQDRCVKIYGAGGLQQLEAFQSGALVSAEGHVVTVASVVLDQDTATVLSASGQRLEGAVVGVDPLMDIAVLKLEAEDLEFPYFELDADHTPFEGMRVLAYSNLYNVATGDEPVSVLHGVLSAIAPLEARRGAFATRYRGDVYILDAATNNPGAAGGVLLDTRGTPIGMLGKEVKSELTGSWLNYALPWKVVARSVKGILNGELGGAITPTQELPDKPATLQQLGFRLVPSVVPRTPPYVDAVIEGSPADSAGLRTDDLVIAVAGMRTGTYLDVQQALNQTPSEQPVRVTLLRGSRLVDVSIEPNRDGTTP